MLVCSILIALPTSFVAVTTPLETSASEASASLGAALVLEPVEPSSSTFFVPAAVEHRGGGTYLRASAGLVTMQDADSPDEDIEFNEGYLLGLAIGQRMNANSAVNFDLELEAVWTDQDADDDGPIQAVNEVSFGALFLNGMFDFELGERLSIYAGAGIGAAWVDVGTEGDALNDFSSDDGPYLAWQGRAGLQWSFSPGFAANVGYRFINNDDVQIDDDIGAADFDLKTEQHVLELGLTFGI